MKRTAWKLLIAFGLAAASVSAQPEPFELRIEKTHRSYQGGYEHIDVSATKGSSNLWGFDLVLTYDDDALSFQSAEAGSIYDSCSWEYFTYRVGPNVLCPGDCPTGRIRLVGIAETNNGPYHPTCYDAAGRTLAILDFLISNDRTYECQYIPIRFFWIDCGDNSLAYDESAMPDPYGLELAVNRYITDGCSLNIADGATSFPTIHGVPDSCLEGDQNVPVRFIDFHNGGIKTTCADSIDPRGDINLNGTPFEIADAMLFSEYFVYGAGVFSHPLSQPPLTDINSDGEALTLEDLMCLWLLINGDITRECQPPPPPPVYATYRLAHSTLSLLETEPLGIMLLTLSGDVEPDLLVSGFSTLLAYDQAEDVTRMLIYDPEAANPIESGDVLFLYDHDLLGISAATMNAAPVIMQTAQYPSDALLLEQNFPNPFVMTAGSSTEIYAVSGHAGNGRIEIFNTLGQTVYSAPVDFLSAGSTTITWPGTSSGGKRVAPGVYFYRLTLGDTRLTRKMMLLK